MGVILLCSPQPRKTSQPVYIYLLFEETGGRRQRVRTVDFNGVRSDSQQLYRPELQSPPLGHNALTVSTVRDFLTILLLRAEGS